MTQFGFWKIFFRCETFVRKTMLDTTIPCNKISNIENPLNLTVLDPVSDHMLQNLVSDGTPSH